MASQTGLQNAQQMDANRGTYAQGANGLDSADPEKAKRQTDEEKRKAQELVKRFNQRKTERFNWEATWQTCMDNILPRKGNIISTSIPGDKRGHDLFDTTAIMANQLLAGALHGMLTNPATRFFDLIAADPELNQFDDVRQWLDDCADRIFKVLSNSNYQTEIHELYVDLGAIGTACMFIGEHPERVVHFSARAIKEIYIDENNEGLVDCVDRLFKWSPRQIIQEFGIENCPEEVIKKLNAGDTAELEVLHCTYPMSDEQYQSKGRLVKFESIYVLVENPFIFQEGFFPEFPYVVPRWTKTSGEKYGRGPGMDMLPDILMVNKMMEVTIKSAEKVIDPPMMVAHDGVIGRVKLTPGGMTTVRNMEENPIRPLITDARVDIAEKIIEGVRQRIRSGFYVDQLQLHEGDRMTTVEVNQRTQEQLRYMGPVLGRQHFENLKPTIDRVFPIMARRKLLPQAPDRLKGKKIDVQYSSLLARAQRSQDGESLMRAIQMVAPLVNAKPQALDILDEDKAFTYVFEMNGIPPRIFRDARAIKQLRDGRQAAQEQAAKEQQQAHQADVASKMGPAAAQLMQAQATQQQAKEGMMK